MPLKSKAQFRKLLALEEEGKVKKGTAEKWAKETPNIDKLPARKKTITSIQEIKVIAERKAKKK